MQQQVIKYAKDYQPPAYWITHTNLTFYLHDGFTEVQSVLQITRNHHVVVQDLVLDGQELQLESMAINAQRLHENAYHVTEETLIISSDLLADNFELACTTLIYPEKNTSLEGLYRSRGMFCTQCEAEGFRKITYYLDRPDVMSEFTVTLVAESDKFPVMLSNGNCISDITKNNYREVVWHDPFKKPCYLFALVAGNLDCLQDTFITMSGREVVLKIFVESKDLDKCDFAMDSLKRSMRWDEEVYGREYDLDIFMIVAVDDFNMGAMENKGLNIFNTSCVLANLTTTTDDGFERVEAVVAHEYFHNWSGNRVTCRDWFQLSLKEGFTVYRDAEFSADMNSRDVKRIEDVIFLRGFQFVEDAGPMAHPIRPDAYIEISNFYTVTIYEKGAEVVRMLANLLGKVDFRKATDLYFSRHDGQAVTCDDFILAAEDATGVDLTQFRLWYSQSGTPTLKVTDHYDENTQRYTLHIEQILPSTPGQLDKKPFFIPVKIALYSAIEALPLYLQGSESSNSVIGKEECLLLITDLKQSYVFERVMQHPSPSLLRGFTAPVKLHYAFSDEQLAYLIALDADGFSRWDACQALYTKILISMVNNTSVDTSINRLLVSLRKLLTDKTLDNAMLALMLNLPSQQYLADYVGVADPVAIYSARETLALLMAQSLRAEFVHIFAELSVIKGGIDFLSRSQRTIKNTMLSYLMLLEEPSMIESCLAQLTQAEVMSDKISAFRALLHCTASSAQHEAYITAFYEQWKHEPLVVNLWLQAQAASAQIGNIEHIRQLMQHQGFDYSNPNKIRALIGAFATSNTLQFHKADGSGYQFLAEQVAKLDKINPQIAARLLAPLTRWQAVDARRSKIMQQVLQQLSKEVVSKDVSEVVSKSLLLQ